VRAGPGMRPGSCAAVRRARRIPGCPVRRRGGSALDVRGRRRAGMVHESRSVRRRPSSPWLPCRLPPTRAPRYRGPAATPLGASRRTSFLSAYQDDEIRRWHTRRPATETQVPGVARRMPPGLGTREGRSLGDHPRRRRSARPDRTTTASSASGTGCSRPPAAPVSPRGSSRRSVPGPLTRSASTVRNWTTQRTTMLPAGSPQTPANSWKAPSAAPPSTTTADTTCMCTPASEAIQWSRKKCLLNCRRRWSAVAGADARIISEICGTSSRVARADIAR